MELAKLFAMTCVFEKEFGRAEIRPEEDEATLEQQNISPFSHIGISLGLLHCIECPGLQTRLLLVSHEQQPLLEEPPEEEEEELVKQIGTMQSPPMIPLVLVSQQGVIGSSHLKKG